MPMFEMPLDDLRSYQGRNPKPADFDAYWRRALDELAATPADVELKPHLSVSEFFHDAINSAMKPAAKELPPTKRS